MIKFFRRIRYSLMERNQTGKYLKYAIGEIVLVVIGIFLPKYIQNILLAKGKKCFTPLFFSKFHTGTK